MLQTLGLLKCFIYVFFTNNFLLDREADYLIKDVTLVIVVPYCIDITTKPHSFTGVALGYVTVPWM